jgi:serine phosphatase RsbU (regulator of sigma subunit)/anti-sigma regulatory factor (Ser/Thr protein kinase)
MFRSVKKEEITIPAQMSYLLQVREFIEHIGKRYKYSEKMVNSFKLVIDEACTNIIRHGYRDIKNGEIKLKAIIRRLSLTIVIIDQGISYDPRQANTPDLAKYVDIGKKGGLGILMMRKLMDDIQYVVTEKGNEFRLTKVREVTDEPKVMQIWHALNMRTRYSLISSVIFTFIIIIIFGLLFINLKSDVDEEILSAAATGARSLAENSVTDMLENKSFPLYVNITSVLTSTEIDINKIFVVNTKNIIKAGIKSGNKSESGGKYKLPETATMIDSSEFAVIYRYSINDSIEILDVVSEISEKGFNQEPLLLGEAHIWIAQSTIDNIISGRQLALIIALVIILAIGYTGSFYLVSQILKSFHRLADWVRQVVRGKVDQDEIDIDASDEIGEIAQAFNEMTKKFQKAQVNLIEQQKLQKELQVAQEIQQMLLPSDFPEVDGFDIGSYYEAAKEVGGDLFDFVEVDDETVGIVVADVSGKGVPGSLIMTMIRTAIRLESRGNKNPADVLARVNRFVTGDMLKGMFVTMFYIILDSRNRIIHYASAGHNPMMLFRSSAKQTYYLNPTGFPVGIQLPDIDLFEKRIETDSIRLREDDILVLYTDGITEAMNHQRELYREERFLQSIRDNGHLDVAEFVKSIKNDLKDFTGGAPQNDDITFVAVKEKLMAGEIIYKMHKHVVDLINDGMRVKDACDKLKISQYQYYKYKGIVDEGGLDALKEFLDGKDHIEKKHISIEVKSKIFDIIRSNPKYGAKKISSLLNTEKYGFVELEERRIYNDLIKQRLNTYKLRQRFVEKGQNKRLKQPGTPLLTLDGKVILDFDSSANEISKRTGSAPAPKPVGGHSEEVKKPFIREMSTSRKDDSALIMHQTGKIYDPAKHKEEKVASKTQEATPAAQKAPDKPQASQSVKVVEKEQVEQVAVPTKDDLTEKAIEKIDQNVLEKFYKECQDDFSGMAKLVDEMKKTGPSEAMAKKINLILKIVLKNPILKKLQEVHQLFLQGQGILEKLSDNFSGLKKAVIIENSETVLNYLAKENILNSSNSIIEKINKLGLINKELQMNQSSQKQKINKLDDIRSKIVKKQLVTDAAILKSLDEDPKS